MFIHIFIIFFLVLLIPNTTFAQQASMVWDEKSKSWVSTPAPAAATTPTPTQTPQIQTQLPQQPPTTYIQQPQPALVTPAQSTVDLGTLMTVITPILAGIAGIFVKNRKDMEKKTEETKADTIKTIQEAIAPHLKQITPVAEQTAKQDVKIQQLAEEMYKLMAEKANEIHDKPEIQQQKLIEDSVRSKMIAEQTKTTPSMQWDDVKKEWVSK
jgi:hypothetical protein